MTVGVVAVVGILTVAGIGMLRKDTPSNTDDTQQVDNSTESNMVADKETTPEVNQDTNTDVEDTTPDTQTPPSTEEQQPSTDTEQPPQEDQKPPTNPGGLTPNSQGFVILDEDANGDGLLSRTEAKADGYVYYSLRYNDDGSNTTYLVDIRDGSIVHPGGRIEGPDGGYSIWCGHTQEDVESIWGEKIE